MFVSCKGSHEAIGVLYRGRFGRGGRLKIVDGINMDVTFKPFLFRLCEMRVYEKDFDQELRTGLCPSTSPKDKLARYLCKYHRGSTTWVWSSRLQEFLPSDDKELEVEKEIVVLD